ncbi:MAG: hypothetical protein WCL50_02560 [Spirochaetota bacterium]
MFLLERILLYIFFFVGLPTLAFFFIRTLQRDKSSVERLKYQKEVLELEVKKEEARAKSLAEENRKYDRIIENEESKPGDGAP